LKASIKKGRYLHHQFFFKHYKAKKKAEEKFIPKKKKKKRPKVGRGVCWGKGAVCNMGGDSWGLNSQSEKC